MENKEYWQSVIDRDEKEWLDDLMSKYDKSFELTDLNLNDKENYLQNRNEWIEIYKNFIIQNKISAKESLNKHGYNLETK